jgi:3-hydroxyacyl-CoA dehydrogenase
MAISPPPKKDNQSQPILEAEPKIDKVTKKKQDAFINKGGKPVNETVPSDKQVLKNINVSLLESELKTINELRDKRRKPRGRKIAISLHDWIIEAIQEKIQKESRKFIKG